MPLHRLICIICILPVYYLHMIFVHIGAKKIHKFWLYNGILYAWFFKLLILIAYFVKVTHIIAHQMQFCVFYAYLVCVYLHIFLLRCSVCAYFVHISAYFAWSLWNGVFCHVFFHITAYLCHILCIFVHIKCTYLCI